MLDTIVKAVTNFFTKYKRRRMFEQKYKTILSQLKSPVAKRAVELLTVAQADGIELAITSGHRSNEEQARLYAQGRTAPGPIVTGAKPGTSWHNHRLAFDVAPLNAAGKPHWPNDLGLWERIGRHGESVGLSWGGRWTKPDRPHFEYHPGLTIQDAIAGRSIPEE